jgi:adenosylhomocysteine nucleosidase
VTTENSGSGNNGVINTGTGNVSISGSVLGQRNVLNRPRQQRKSGRQSLKDLSTPNWDIGVITILTQETSAVIDALGSAGPCRQRIRAGGLRFYEASVPAGGQRAAVVLTQALDQGQRAAVMAYSQLHEHYGPACVALVGIAGGISPMLRLGDVVVVRDVTYYDARRETPSGTAHRGQEHHVPAHIRRAINAFFTARGEPYPASHSGPDGSVRSFHVLPGPIGSGEAVITDQNSPIRSYLTEYNEKILAVETEAAGIAEAFYSQAGHTSADRGWLAIRGISDHADTAKDYSYHRIASDHAAAILMQLLPYLIDSTASTGD